MNWETERKRELNSVHTSRCSMRGDEWRNYLTKYPGCMCLVKATLCAQDDQFRREKLIQVVRIWAYDCNKFMLFYWVILGVSFLCARDSSFEYGIHMLRLIVKTNKTHMQTHRPRLCALFYFAFIVSILLLSVYLYRFVLLRRFICSIFSGRGLGPYARFCHRSRCVAFFLPTFFCLRSLTASFSPSRFTYTLLRWNKDLPIHLMKIRRTKTISFSTDSIHSNSAILPHSLTPRVPQPHLYYYIILNWIFCVGIVYWASAPCSSTLCVCLCACVHIYAS